MTAEKLASRVFAVVLASAMWLASPVLAHQDPEIAGYIQVDGGRIWYRLNGSKHLGIKPALIVSHGGPGGNHRGNMPFVSLSDEYPVILYDQLGTGNSDWPNDPDNWQVDRFVAEIEQLPETTRNTLRKHESEGTTDHPDYRAAEEIFYQSHMCRKNPCPGEQYRLDGPPRNERMYETMWGPTEFFAPGRLSGYDISSRLSRITEPTLMICGEYDEAVPKSCQRYADMIDDSRVLIVPDAGHSTMREDEALYIRTIRSFLAEKLLQD